MRGLILNTWQITCSKEHRHSLPMVQKEELCRMSVRVQGSVVIKKPTQPRCKTNNGESFNTTRHRIVSNTTRHGMCSLFSK